MPAQRHVFTSESVTEGHPDKIADQISDAVLDAIIAKDPAARVACETLVTTGMAVVAAAHTPPPNAPIPPTARGPRRPLRPPHPTLRPHRPTPPPPPPHHPPPRPHPTCAV